MREHLEARVSQEPRCTKYKREQLSSLLEMYCYPFVALEIRGVRITARWILLPVFTKFFYPRRRAR